MATTLCIIKLMRFQLRQMSIFNTLVLRLLFATILALNFTPTTAFAVTSAGSCRALFDSENASEETVSFEWYSAIQKLRTTTNYFDFDLKLFYSMMSQVDKLTTKQKNLLLKQLATDYHSLNKELNRRKVETLIVKLGRFDLLFEKKLKQGLSPLEAYDFVHETIRKLVGDAKAFQTNFLLEVAEALRVQLGPNDAIYLYGSAVTGRSVVGKSDIDLRYVHPLNSNRSQVDFERELVKSVRDITLQRYDLTDIEIQAFDITPDQVHSEQAWAELGMPGPFVIEVRQDGIFLYVYTPQEMVFIPPPETREWQIEYKNRVTGYQRYRLK